MVSDKHYRVTDVGAIEIAWWSWFPTWLVYRNGIIVSWAGSLGWVSCCLLFSSPLPQFARLFASSFWENISAQSKRVQCLFVIPVKWYQRNATPEPAISYISDMGRQDSLMECHTPHVTLIMFFTDNLQIKKKILEISRCHVLMKWSKKHPPLDMHLCLSKIFLTFTCAWPLWALVWLRHWIELSSQLGTECSLYSIEVN